MQQHAATPNPMKGRPPHALPNLLRVVDGMHRGAQVPLQRSGLTIIGSADDCDLILMDEGVAARHAAITVHERAITVRAIDGEVSLDGQAVAPGEIATPSAGTPMVIGSATIVIGGEIPADERLSPQSSQPERESAQIPGEAEEGEPADAQPSPTGLHGFLRNKLRTRVVVIGCSVAAVSLAAILVISTSMSPRGLPPEKRVAMLLKDLKLEGEVQVSSPRPGVVALTGTAPDEATHSALVRALAAQGVAPVLRVAIGERLAAAVKDVFRVNGFTVDTEYAQGGVVLVTGVSEGDRRINPVIQHALKDVRGLNDIRIGKSSRKRMQSSGTLANSQPSGSFSSAAKRVVSVVEGSPAYLVTADGARYFVGATLPEGHRVVSISNGTVTLERDGEQIVMTF